MIKTGAGLTDWADMQRSQFLEHEKCLRKTHDITEKAAMELLPPEPVRRHTGKAKR